MGCWHLSPRREIPASASAMHRVAANAIALTENLVEFAPFAQPPPTAFPEAARDFPGGSVMTGTPARAAIRDLHTSR